MPFRSISHQHYSISTALNDINNSTNSTSPYDVLLQIHPIGLGVIFTTINWLFTTLGAAACFFMICCAKSTNRFYDDFLALSFGLGGGIMLAASFFSLLVPAIELSEKQYPEYVSVLPVFGGFAIGIIFFLVFDVALDYINDYVEKKKIQYDRELQKLKENELSTIQPMLSHHEATPSSTSLLQASDSCENIIRPSKEEDKTDQSCVELP
ncbi:hypothetical protein C9374_005150 [Naegleria lovaniensis]|uniref:Uncharacterized protein n=1 Tax=Naegleria lovaniensis TaxID=51637 RepID=A0AA88GLR7_NAELO|nr:uncharacterized protein C9374_005150 [Naegleria lovaniensis]KAG2382570.1 hypothetical protein C9374_005150 [Naegleria lovaniensis]